MSNTEQREVLVRPDDLERNALLREPMLRGERDTYEAEKRYLHRDGSPEDLLGKNMHEVMHHSHANGIPYPQQECKIYTSFREGKPSDVTDEVLWVQMNDLFRR